MNVGSSFDANVPLMGSGLASHAKKTSSFSLQKALLIVGVVGLFACVTLNCMQSEAPHEPVQLWERECYTCTHCEGDQLQIIAAFYGDKVVTGEFVYRYNKGTRNFPASDSQWGKTWSETKKTLVLVFKMCGSVYSKAIYEGQALVLPE